jgi:rhodanese-related sulfurtransferase
MTADTEKEKKAPTDSSYDHLPEEKLAEIARGATTRVVPAGTILFRQGDSGDSFYIIRYGRIKAFRVDDEGVETDLAELGPGDSFGEIPLLTGQPRTASVVTLEETCLSVLSKEQFDQILKDHPVIALSFVKQMTKLVLQDWSKLQKETRRQYRAPKMSWLDFFGIFVLTLLCGLLFNMSNPNGINLVPDMWSDEPVASVVPSVARSKQENFGALFVDARPNGFYKQERIKGAVNIPLSLFDIMYVMELAEIERDKEIIVYGRSISSRYDEKLVRKLVYRGHKKVSRLAGGLSAWKKKGYATEP